jgi:hypothetical protein
MGSDTIDFDYSAFSHLFRLRRVVADYLNNDPAAISILNMTTHPRTEIFLLTLLTTVNSPAGK